MLVTLLAITALAAELPDLSDPVRSGSDASTDYAVVVGIEDYAFVSDVPYAAADAAAFLDFVVYTRGVPASRVRDLSDGAARERIEEALTEAGRATGSGDAVWVYFAGHGIAGLQTGERLLLGVDVQPREQSLATRGLSVSRTVELAGAGGAQVYLVLDACYGGTGRGGEELLEGKRFVVPVSATQSAAAALQWSATSSSELSGPIDAVGHGAFTYFVVGALRGWADGELDGRRDKQVTAAEASAYVQRMLRAAQVEGQSPSLIVGPEMTPESMVLSGGRLERGPSEDQVLNVGKTTVVRQEPKAVESQPAHESLDEAEIALRRKCRQDWEAMAEQVLTGAPSAWLMTEQFLDLYSDASVTVGGKHRDVDLPDVARVRWLRSVGMQYWEPSPDLRAPLPLHHHWPDLVTRQRPGPDGILMSKAAEALVAEDLAAARVNAEGVRDLYPGSDYLSEALLVLAEAQVRQGKLKTAVTTWRDVLLIEGAEPHRRSYATFRIACVYASIERRDDASNFSSKARQIILIDEIGEKRLTRREVWRDRDLSARSLRLFELGARSTACPRLSLADTPYWPVLAYDMISWDVADGRDVSELREELRQALRPSSEWSKANKRDEVALDVAGEISRLLDEGTR